MPSSVFIDDPNRAAAFVKKLLEQVVARSESSADLPPVLIFPAIPAEETVVALIPRISYQDALEPFLRNDMPAFVRKVGAPVVAFASPYSRQGEPPGGDEGFLVDIITGAAHEIHLGCIERPQGESAKLHWQETQRGKRASGTIPGTVQGALEKETRS